MSATQLPSETSEKIRLRIFNDMNPSLALVNLKLALAVILGGIISLAICGQFGMGMTGWAEILSHKIHEEMPPLLCASICGTIYAIFPTLLLRLLLCSPMQYQMILKKRFFTLAVWYSGVGYALATYGEHGQRTEEIFFWVLAALITSYTLTYLMKKLLPRWSLRASLA